MINLEKINKMYSFLLEAADSSKYTPYKRSGSKFSITLAGKNEDAFMLSSIKCGVMETVKADIPSSYKDGYMLIRSTVGYANMRKMENDFDFGILFLSGLINEMMADAHEYEGAYNLTFKRPDDSKMYFKELENAAGFEIRLYGEIK